MYISFKHNHLIIKKYYQNPKSFLNDINIKRYKIRILNNIQNRI